MKSIREIISLILISLIFTQLWNCKKNKLIMHIDGLSRASEGGLIECVRYAYIDDDVVGAVLVRGPQIIKGLNLIQESNDTVSFVYNNEFFLLNRSRPELIVFDGDNLSKKLNLSHNRKSFELYLKSLKPFDDAALAGN
jgi:hypothetical protein